MKVGVFCITIILVVCFKHAYAQQPVGYFDFSIGTSCGAPDLTGSWSLQNKASGFISGEGSFVANLYFAGTPSGSIQVAISGTCSKTNQSIEINFTDNFSFDEICEQKSFTHVAGVGQNVTLTITYKPVFPITLEAPIPSGPVSCTELSVSFQLQTAAQSPFIWQVSDDGENWQQIPKASGYSLVASAAVFSSLQFQSTNRFVRAKKIQCGIVSLSNALGPYTFPLKPPTFGVTPTNPTCYNDAQSINGSNGKNGSITINNFTGFGPAGFEYACTLYKGNDPNPFQQQSLTAPNGLIFSDLEPGNYKVAVFNNGDGGCGQEIPVSIANPTPLVLTLNQALPTSCNSAENGPKADGKIKLNLDHTTGYTYSFTYAKDGSATGLPITPDNNTVPTPVFSGLSKGKYRFQGSYNVGSVTCKSVPSAEIEVAEPLPLKVDLESKTDVVCKGKNTGQISIDKSGGNGSTYNYSWSGPSFTSMNEDISSLFAGTYSVILRNNLNCETKTSAAFSVIEPPTAINATSQVTSKALYGNYDVSCNQNDGAALVTVTGNSGNLSTIWKKNNVLFVPNSSTSPSGLTPGSYSVTIQDQLGCTASTSFNVAPHPGISAATHTLTSFHGYNTRCADSEDGAAEVTPSSTALLPITYQWIDYPSQTTKTISNVGKGTYTVIVRDANHCEATGTVTISSPPAIQPGIQATTNFNGYAMSCPGQSDGVLEAFPVNGTAPYSYSWSNQETSKAIGSLKAGTYSVVVTDSEGCEGIASKTIADPPAILPNLKVTSNYNGKSISCPAFSDGIIEAFPTNGKAPYVYNWSNGSTAKFASGLAAGTHQVTVTDSYGCAASASLTITDPAPLGLSLTKKNYNGVNVRCENSSDGEIQLTVVGTPSTYLWSNGATTKNIVGVPSGKYVVQVRDENNCVFKDSTVLIAPAKLVPTVVPLSNYHGYGVSCRGFSDGSLGVQVVGGVSPFLYQWSNGRTTSVITNVKAGDYVISVKDKNGCIASATGTVLEPDALVLSAIQAKAVTCNGFSDGHVELHARGGAPPYLFSRDEINWLPNSLYDTISYGKKVFFAKDKNSCISYDSIAIEQPGKIQIQFSDLTPATCNDAVGAVSATATGGVGLFSYQWYDAISRDTLSVAPLLSGRSSGVYQVLATDLNQCEQTDQVAIPSIGGVEYIFENVKNATCSYLADGEATVTVVSGPAPFSFLWSNGQTAKTATSLSSGKYFITVTDSLGCKNTSQVTVDAPEPITTSVSKKRPICFGDCNGEITLGHSGGTAPYTTDWPELNKQGSDVTGLCVGNYTFNITDAQSCLFNGQAELTQPQPLMLSGEHTDPTCNGKCDGTIQLTSGGGTGVHQYLWSTGQTEQERYGLCPGQYSVLAKDVNGCSVNKSFSIADGPILSVYLGDETTLCTGQKMILDPGEEWSTINWSSSKGFAATSQTVVVTEAAVYRLEAKSKEGCLGQGSLTLKTDNNLLKSEFIMTPEIVVGDTLVAIDISWPVPDSVVWIFPSSIEQLSNPAPDFLFLVPDHEGKYQIGQRAFLAECRAYAEKTLIVKPSKSNGRESDFLGFTELILLFTASPNPNHGEFDVNVELAEEAEAEIRLMRLPNGSEVVNVISPAQRRHHIPVRLPAVAPGVYLLILQSRGERRTLRLIIH